MSETPPPSPSSPSRIRDAWRGFTSVRAREATGAHLLRIEGYSAATRMLGPGEGIATPVFRAGGHRWRLSLYPNGKEREGRVSAEVSLMDKRGFFSHRFPEATAECRISVLSRDGGPALVSRSAGLCRYERGWSIFRGESSLVDVAATEAERAAVLRQVGDDDTLVVRCDVSVPRLEKESRVLWYLRRFLD